MEIKRIIKADEVNERLTLAMQSLCKQLTNSAPKTAIFPHLGQEELRQIIAEEHTALFMAMAKDGNYIGTTTVHVWRHPVRKRAFIDDVVVDSNNRGQGAAMALVQAAVDFAKSESADYIELTCNSKARPEAAQLYLKMGFEIVQTDVFRFALSQF
ncbi:MAG TPA: GNAT family N-acetyltransferase [Candidatus Saccharimonadales bacterium]|nr:GNAT family N-acetyltransferase [Candidatus Saccharimonadales bacterium]